MSENLCSSMHLLCEDEHDVMNSNEHVPFSLVRSYPPITLGPGNVTGQMNTLHTTSSGKREFRKAFILEDDVWRSVKFVNFSTYGINDYRLLCNGNIKIY
jgi:hypothetical protein